MPLSLPVAGGLGEPVAEGVDEGSVGPQGYDFQRRVAPLPRQVECQDQRGTGNGEVRPGVQGPLAVPSPLPRVGKWIQIGYSPLVAVRAARADEIAEKVQVETRKRQYCRLPAY